MEIMVGSRRTRFYLYAILKLNLKSQVKAVKGDYK